MVPVALKTGTDPRLLGDALRQRAVQAVSWAAIAKQHASRVTVRMSAGQGFQTPLAVGCLSGVAAPPRAELLCARVECSGQLCSCQHAHSKTFPF
jgi:nicotinamidase-related amidase